MLTLCILCISPNRETFIEKSIITIQVNSTDLIYLFSLNFLSVINV